MKNYNNSNNRTHGQKPYSEYESHEEIIKYYHSESVHYKRFKMYASYDLFINKRGKWIPLDALKALFFAKDSVVSTLEEV